MSHPAANIYRNDIIHRLLLLPAELAEAEREVMAAQRTLSACREDLADREAHIVLEGAPGKNAEERGAHVRLATTGERLALQQAEEELKLAAVRLHTLQAEHASLRAAARLLAGDNHD